MAQKITFSLSPEIAADATEGLLLGDFNNWLEEAGVKLKKQKDGSLKASINLEPGTYQYRYFLNDGRWVNDGNAGGYNFVGEFGVDNCVISVAAEEVKETVAKGQLVAAVTPAPKKVVAKKVAEPKAVAPKTEKVAAPKEKAVKAAAPKAPAKVAAPKAPAKAAAPKAPASAPKAAVKKVAAPAKKATKK